MKRAALSQNLTPSIIVPAVTAGMIVGVLQILVQISYATLIFSGPLSSYLGQGIGLALFGSFVLALVMALTSTFPATVAAAQDSPAAILALVSVSISVGISATGNTSAAFATMISAIVLTALLMGVFFFALGYFKLGRFVRYIPLPVIGGFLAGTGWLLVQGGINVMLSSQVTTTGLDFISPPLLLRWVPGVLLAIVLLLVLRRWTHALVIPGIVLGTILLFYLILTTGGVSIEQARAGNWMLGPFPTGALFQFTTVSALLGADWGVLFRQADKIATILMISGIGVLLNTSGIELASQQDVDLNHELKAVGVANMLTSIGAGLPGFVLFDSTALSYRLGARSRLTGITVAVLFAFALFAGASAFSYFPRPVLGGLLVFSGLTFLQEWLYEAFFNLSHLDYALILLILAVIVGVGFLPGIGVGIFVAMFLFIINYSRITVIKHSLSGTTVRSAVERSPAQREHLREQGNQMFILQLQEFIFFGTGQHLLDCVRERLNNRNAPPLRYLLLDFRRVSGLDASAISSFQRLIQLTRTQQVETIFTEVAPSMQTQLERGKVRNIRYFATLDRGIEWCENRILAQTPSPLDAISYTFQAQLVHYLPDPLDRARLQSYLERVELAANSILVRQDEPADALYFIEEGVLSVDITLGDGTSLRIRRIQSGTILGEIGVYLGGMRTATVTALEPTIAYRLTGTALGEMERRDPDLATAIHKWNAVIMAERLANEIRMIEALMG